MTARDCILGKAAEGLVDRGKAEDAARRFDEAVNDIRQRGRTKHEAERMAAVRIH